MKAEFAAALVAALVAGAFFYSAIGEDLTRAPASATERAAAR
jgi:hypothetical protein